MVRCIICCHLQEDSNRSSLGYNASIIHWAMDAILKWKSEDLTSSYTHIHGTRDEVLPVRFTKPTHFITKGGHLLVMNRAGEVNAILREVLVNW